MDFCRTWSSYRYARACHQQLVPCLRVISTVLDGIRKGRPSQKQVGVQLPIASSSGLSDSKRKSPLTSSPIAYPVSAGKRRMIQPPHQGKSIATMQRTSLSPVSYNSSYMTSRITHPQRVPALQIPTLRSPKVQGSPKFQSR